MVREGQLGWGAREERWEPFLDEERESWARGCLAHICDDLAKLDRAQMLAPFAADIAVLFDEVARLRALPADASIAEEAAGIAFGSLSSSLRSGIFDGLSHFAWLNSLLASAGGPNHDDDERNVSASGPESGPRSVEDIEQEPDGNDELDDALLESLADTRPWPDSYDLISGLAGLGAYFAFDLTSAKRRAGLELVVIHLERLSQTTPDGITWVRPVGLQRRPPPPRKGYDVGVAHGVPGPLMVLAWAWASGVAERRSMSLIEGARSWLLARTQDPANATMEGESSLSPSYWPSFWEPGQVSSPSRLAWCYGDPGVATVLLHVGRLLGDDELYQLGHRALLRSIEIPYEASGVVDAGLCHGAAGLVHLYHRAFRLTGDERFRDATLTWLDHLRRLQREEGCGGFLAHVPSDIGRGTRDMDLLNGSAGVGLCLAALLSHEPPQWDSRLLMATPSDVVSRWQRRQRRQA